MDTIGGFGVSFFDVEIQMSTKRGGCELGTAEWTAAILLGGEFRRVGGIRGGRVRHSFAERAASIFRKWSGGGERSYRSKAVMGMNTQVVLLS